MDTETDREVFETTEKTALRNKLLQLFGLCWIDERTRATTASSTSDMTETSDETSRFTPLSLLGLRWIIGNTDKDTTDNKTDARTLESQKETSILKGLLPSIALRWIADETNIDSTDSKPMETQGVSLPNRLLQSVGLRWMLDNSDSGNSKNDPEVSQPEEISLRNKLLQHFGVRWMLSGKQSDNATNPKVLEAETSLRDMLPFGLGWIVGETKTDSADNDLKTAELTKETSLRNKLLQYFGLRWILGVQTDSSVVETQEEISLRNRLLQNFGLQWIFGTTQKDSAKDVNDWSLVDLQRQTGLPREELLQLLGIRWIDNETQTGVGVSTETSTININKQLSSPRDEALSQIKYIEKSTQTDTSDISTEPTNLNDQFGLPRDDLLSLLDIRWTDDETKSEPTKAIETTT